MWSGAEPASGEFNGTYFQITAEIVNTLAAHGIYTMFDMHGRWFCAPMRVRALEVFFPLLCRGRVFKPVLSLRRHSIVGCEQAVTSA
jgi:hypothetical protein